MKFSKLLRKITALLTASAFVLSVAANYPAGFGIASAEAQTEVEPVVIVQTAQAPELCPGLGSLYDVGTPVSLWGLRGGASFNGSYYNQLDDNSKKVYDALYAAYVDSANTQNVVFSDISTTFTDVVITRTSSQGTNDQGQIVTYYTDSFSEDFYAQLKEWENNILKPGYLALVYDHPELGWLVNVEYWKSSSSLVYDKNSLQVGENTNVSVDASGFGFYFDEATVAGLEYRGNSTKVNIAVTKAVSAINADIGSSTVRYDIVKGIHDYLCDNLTYYSNQSQLDSFYQTAYSAFYNIDGGTDNLLAVCAGYAKAFKLLCDEYGIPCVYVSGEDNTGGPHGWNYVQMEDGNWYGVDVTWDDQESKTYYQFFLSGSETKAPNFNVTDFGTSHIASGDWAGEGYNFVYPAICSEAYIYTEKNDIADAELYTVDSNGGLSPVLQYDGTVKTPAFRVTLNGETLDPETDYTLSGELTGTNAGNYTVTITGKGDYTGTAAGEWTITKASAANWTCTTVPATLTYTGNSLSPVITVKDGSTVIPSTEYTIDGVTEAADAGTYTFTITPSANYSETASKEYTWTINKKTATLMSPAANSLTYNGQPQELVVAGTPAGGTMQYSLDGGISWSADIPTASNAGDYTVTAMVKGDKNHEDSLTVTTKVTIAKKNISSVTITLDKDSCEFTGSEITPVVTVKDGETTLIKDTDYTLSGDLTATAVGDYTITVTGNGNYTGTVSKSYSVVKDTIYIDSKDITGDMSGTGWELVDGILTLDEGYNFNVTITDSEKITTVTNNGTIVGGDFGGTWLVNNGSITGGTFYIVNNYEGGTISGGTFQMIICFGGSIVVKNESVNVNTTVFEPDYNGIDCTVTIDGKEHTHTLEFISCSKLDDTEHTSQYCCNECSLNYMKVEYIAHSVSKYSASGNVISAACECNHDMGAVITLNAPTDLTYNGKAKEATITTDLATKPEITYCCKDGCIDAGTHTASVTYEGVTATTTFTIEKLAISNENVTVGTKSFEYTGAKRIHSLAIDTITLTIDGKEYDIKGQLNVADTETLFVNAGTYTMTLEAPEDSNFTGTVTADWEITRVDITTAVFGDGADENSKEVVFTKEYDGNTAFDTSAVKGIRFGEAAYIFEGFTVTVNAADADVGENKELTAVITIDDSMKDNFNKDSYTVTVTGSITKIAPEYTAPAANELTYNGTAQALVKAGESEDGTFWYSLTGNNYTTDIPEATDAGNYIVYYHFAGDENHGNVSAKQIEVTIAPMDIKDAVVDVDDEKFFYSNGYNPTEPSVSIDGKTLTEDTDYTLITDRIGPDAGEYDVTVEGKGNYTGTATGKATIEKADLSSVEVIYYFDTDASTAFSKEYDGKNTFNVTSLDYISFKNNVNTYTDLNCKSEYYPTSYDIIVEIACKDASVGENKPLTATITFIDKMQKNFNETSYTLDIPASVATGTITKVKAKVTEEPAANELIYNGEAQALVTSGTAEGGTMMYSLEENGIFTETIPTATNAGDYKVYCYVKGDNDHADSDKSAVDVTIAKADITFTAPEAVENLVYNGKAQAVITAGTASAGTMYYTLTGTDYKTTNPEAKDAGKYTVYWKIEGDENYKDVAEQTFTVTIARKPVTVTARDAQKVYGDADPAFEITYEGFIDADVLEGKAEREAGEDAGVYVIGQGTITNDSNPNYDITFVEGKLTINRKPVTQFSTPAASTVAYGKALSDIDIGDWKWEDGTIIPAVTNNGYKAIRTLTDDNNYDYSAIEGYDAATHTITITLDVFVTPAALAVAADDKYIIVGAEIPEATYTVTGLVNGDKLVTEPTIGYSGADNMTIGEYDIIVSGAKATENYTLTHKNGKLYVALCDHEGTTEYLYDSESHWLHCTKCGWNDLSVTAHSGGTAYCTSQAVCEVCKIPYGKATGHSWAAVFSYDDTYHWHNCQNANCPVADNSKKDGYAVHSYGEWIVETAATPTQGGTEKRTCECGASETRTIPPTGVTPPVTTPSVTTTPPVYTGTTPSWVNPPAPVTTTTTTVTDTPTTLPPVDDDENDEIIDEDDGLEPQIKGENGKMGWEAISDEIADAEEGSKVVVDMNGATEVSEDIFEQIKGRDIELVIELDNGFTWTINGSDVTNPADVDLGVNKGSTIPAKVINAVTGECKYITLTLSHNGDFGFKAVLAVDMGDENEGFYANLYWYTDNDTKFICADKIRKNGKADLTFTHASEYIIVIDETNHGKQIVESGDIDEDAEADVDNIINEEEDDDFNPFTGVTISFTGVIISAAAVMLTRKRKNK